MDTYSLPLALLYHESKVETRKATRTCTTVLDTLCGDMTELIVCAPSSSLPECYACTTSVSTQPPFPIRNLRLLFFPRNGPSLWTWVPDCLMSATRKNLPLKRWPFAVRGSFVSHSSSLPFLFLIPFPGHSGTFPGGVGGETYLELLNQAAPSTLVLLDAYKDVDCILETGRVDFFKINQEELVAITAKLPASVGPVDQSNIPSMARALLSHYHIRYFGVTDGPST